MWQRPILPVKAGRIEKIGGKRERFRNMQRNTPEGILYVFRGRFLKQNTKDFSLDVGFICSFGDKPYKYFRRAEA